MQNIIIIGDQGVGKSSFVLRLTENQFYETYMATIAKDMTLIEYQGRSIALHDHGGSERWQELRQMHYKHADGALVFCDHALNVDKWLKRLEKENPGIPHIVVMNKTDNPKLPNPKGADIYISCKNNYNLENVIPMIVAKMKEPEAIVSLTETLLEYIPWYCSIS